MSKTNKLALLPVVLCFFAMGFIDLIGVTSNHVRNDLQLSDSTTNVFPSLVFFWFLIFSIPAGMLMNKVGRRKTALMSLVVTLFSPLLLVFGESYSLMLVSSSLPGVGNTLMQTSLNPLISTVIEDGNLASTLTFGRFVKAIASFMAPHLTMWGAQANVPGFGLEWCILFPIYLIIGTSATLLLFSTPIEGKPIEDRASSFAECFSLLGKPIVLLNLLGIMYHIGTDVGTDITASKALMECLGMSLNEAAFAASLYFISHTIGCLTDSFFLRVMNSKSFFVISVTMMALAMCGVAVRTSKTVLFVATTLVGYGNSNVFSMVPVRALQSIPGKQSEVDELIIMGLLGDITFPLLMGLASGGFGQVGAIIIMAVGVLYFSSYISKMNNR